MTPEYFPVEHPVHALTSTKTEYFPDGQFVHPPPDTYLPGAQGTVHTLAPALDVLPASHVVHAVAPVFEYVPAEQELHCEAIGS